jgi:hypothetical protein
MRDRRKETRVTAGKPMWRFAHYRRYSIFRLATQLLPARQPPTHRPTSNPHLASLGTYPAVLLCSAALLPRRPTGRSPADSRNGEERNFPAMPKMSNRPSLGEHVPGFAGRLHVFG